MSKWLASVQSLTEVQAIATCLPDIVDMKLPEKGALGALPVDTVREIVIWLNNRCTSSATIGDLPMQVKCIVPALEEMAATGVDYLKIGLFQSPELNSCVESLGEYLPLLSTPVIAVIFADQTDDLAIIQQVKQAGFAGIMVDTASKDGQGLRDHWSQNTIERFAHQAHEQGLLCGLAGALKLEDIPILKPIGADYLGFRSALCHQRVRTSTLEMILVKKVQAMLQLDFDEAM